MSNAKNQEFLKQIGHPPVDRPIKEESADGNPPPLNWKDKDPEDYEGWA